MIWDSWLLFKAICIYSQIHCIYMLILILILIPSGGLIPSGKFLPCHRLLMDPQCVGAQWWSYCMAPKVIKKSTPRPWKTTGFLPFACFVLLAKPVFVFFLIPIPGSLAPRCFWTHLHFDSINPRTQPSAPHAAAMRWRRPRVSRNRASSQERQQFFSQGGHQGNGSFNELF